MNEPHEASDSSAALGASSPTLNLGPRHDLATVPDRSGPIQHEPEDRPADPLLPARIGRFSILSRLGTGGMGVVYEAYDRQLDRRIAIKLLRTSPADDDDETSDDGASKLLREAQRLAQLDHPNVVAVHEVGALEGEVFVAMEFIEGKTLRQWLRGAPRSWPQVLDAFVQAGRGLAAAHRAGLVHRDFKPENAMIDVHGRVRVLDFGLAREAGTGPPSSLVARLIRSGTTGPLTSPIAGTPAYMAPEQHLGLPCDARSDQFSFCVALYEALFGVRPFPDGDGAQRFQAIMSAELNRPTRAAKVPGWLRSALIRGLASVPNRRFPTMDALLHALTEAPRQRRRRTVAGVMVLLMGVAAGLGYTLWVETRDVCSHGAGRVAALWAERSEGLRAAIVGSRAHYAGDTWARLDAEMRARADAWAGLYRATCEARQRDSGEHEYLDLRMACLHDQARDLDAVLTALAELPALSEDTGVAARQAIKVADQLDPVAACGGAEALRAWSRPPDDVHRAMQIEAVRKRLAAARTTGEAGLYKQGLAAAETALAAARELGEPSLVAEGLLRVGNLQKSLTLHARAAATLEDSFWMSLGSGLDEQAAEAAGSLLVVTGYHLDDRERGRLWERTAAALLRRIGGKRRIEGAFYNNRAVVRAHQGQYDAAAEDYRRALEIYAAGGEQDSARVALVLGNMSRVEFMRGNLGAAAEHIEESLAIRQRVLGNDHPDVAITMSNLALVLTDLGELERAATLLRRGLVIEETQHGSSHPKLVPTLENLARTLARQGKFVDAVQLSYRAQHLLEGDERRDPGAMAEVQLGLGTAYALQGRFDEALPQLRQAVALRERHRGGEHPDTAQARLELAEVALLAGQLEEAEPLAREGLATYTRVFGATQTQTAAAQALVGRIALARGAVELAGPMLTRALPVLERGAPLPRGRARAALARVLADTDREKARALADQADLDLKAAGAGFQREREILAAWRAEHLAP